LFACFSWRIAGEREGVAADATQIVRCVGGCHTHLNLTFKRKTRLEDFRPRLLAFFSGRFSISEGAHVLGEKLFFELA
jgi:hypothetical protein